MSDTHRPQAATGQSLWIELGVMALFGLFFAAIGPFDTIDVPAAPRTLYWVAVMLAGGLVIRGVEAAVTRVSAIKGRTLRMLAVTAGTTPIQTLVVQAAGGLLLDQRASPDLYFMLLPAVLIITLAVVVILELLRVVRSPAPPVAQAGPELRSAGEQLMKTPDRLASHLPARLRAATLIALQAEDHYVRVHTDAGSDLVLMRFSDAVADVQETVPGFRLHRSWWASEASLESVSFKRGSGQAQLRGGLSAPVSRTYYPALREAGWS